MYRLDHIYICLCMCVYGYICKYIVVLWGEKSIKIKLVTVKRSDLRNSCSSHHKNLLPILPQYFFLSISLHLFFNKIFKNSIILKIWNSEKKLKLWKKKRSETLANLFWQRTLEESCKIKRFGKWGDSSVILERQLKNSWSLETPILIYSEEGGIGLRLIITYGYEILELLTIAWDGICSFFKGLIWVKEGWAVCCRM